jgi:hypothetical protein
MIRSKSAIAVLALMIGAGGTALLATSASGQTSRNSVTFDWFTTTTAKSGTAGGGGGPSSTMATTTTSTTSTTTTSAPPAGSGVGGFLPSNLPGAPFVPTATTQPAPTPTTLPTATSPATVVGPVPVLPSTSPGGNETPPSGVAAVTATSPPAAPSVGSVSFTG